MTSIILALLATAVVLHLVSVWQQKLERQSSHTDRAAYWAASLAEFGSTLAVTAVPVVLMLSVLRILPSTALPIAYGSMAAGCVLLAVSFLNHRRRYTEIRRALAQA